MNVHFAVFFICNLSILLTKEAINISGKRKQTTSKWSHSKTSAHHPWKKIWAMICPPNRYVLYDIEALPNSEFLSVIRLKFRSSAGRRCGTCCCGSRCYWARHWGTRAEWCARCCTTSWTTNNFCANSSTFRTTYRKGWRWHQHRDTVRFDDRKSSNENTSHGKCHRKSVVWWDIGDRRWCRLADGFKEFGSVLHQSGGSTYNWPGSNRPSFNGMCNHNNRFQSIEHRL